MKIFNVIIVIILCSIFSLSPANKKKHPIKVIHKGISLTEPVECILVEIQNEEGKPKEFYMDVESVVCGDEQCRVDMVRIYWDELGRYQKFKLPKNVTLEKAEGESFSDVDYDKLNNILKDINSPLEDVYKNEIVGTVGGEGIDAMTGETILLEKSAYIKGAAWTCYSLWHWVHGETKQIIRNITGKSFTIAELENLPQEYDYQKLAIDEFARRRDFSEKTVNALLKSIATNPALLKSSLSYWEITPNQTYMDSMQQFIITANTENRILCFSSILQTKQNISPVFFDKLNAIIRNLNYQEIDMFLRILEIQDVITPSVTSQLILLLNTNNNFLITRRVYWFLREQKLSKTQENQINKFYQKRRNKL